MFLADLKGNTAEYTVIKRTDGTTVQNGIIATGMCAELLNCDGETQDMLFLSVKGDCDGDGIITVGDLVTASKIKRTPEQYSYAQTAAVSFGNTDSVTDGDLLKLKTHLLGKSKISSYSAVPSGWNPATLSAEAKSELKNPRRITVTVRADGFSEITGASFMVNYDPTVFTVYAVIAKNTAWETSHYDDGNAITFVTYSNSESVASELVDIVFVIADGDTSQTHLYFSEMTVYGTAAYYCDNTDSVIYLSGEHSSEEESSSETAVSAELKNIGTDIGTLSPGFTPSQKSYILTVPSGTEKVVFNCIPEDENTSVTVKGSEMLSSTGATVYRIYCNNGATSSVYTVTVTFSASEPEESETSIGEQESGNSLAVVFAVVAVILFIGAAVMFILVKKYGFFRR